MLSRDTVQHWLDDYVAAWRSYDPEAIRALFASHVTYAYHPWDEPLRGPDAVVDSWLENRDEPGSCLVDRRSSKPDGQTPRAMLANLV